MTHMGTQDSITGAGGLDYGTHDLPRTRTLVDSGEQRPSGVLRSYPSGGDLDSRRQEVSNLGNMQNRDP
ncbi:hypothetical protein GB937_007813 [Aspergillus fischeri]|nr:hypothetical protein GB937_007813 [Aspergillus fischeri]